MSSLEDFKEFMANKAFGMTKKEAHAKDICVCCKEPWQPKTYTQLGRKEYQISGLCEECFERITKQD